MSTAAVSTADAEAKADIEHPGRSLGWLRGVAIALGPFAVLYAISRIMGDDFPEWADFLHDWRTAPGETSAGPVADGLEDVIQWFRNTEFLGLITGRDLLRALTGWIDHPLEFTEGLLIAGYDPLNLPPIPWLLLAGLATVIGHNVGGWKLAALGGGCVVYLAIFDLWADSMELLSTVLVSAPLAIVVGWALGLWGARSRRFEALMVPVLNVMQSLPHFAYLIPIAVFVGIGKTAGVVATVIFAVPPMAKLTMLGIRGVSSEILDAGHMSGATKRQMLWKVEMPAARPTLMVGINQVIMQCLGMAVIAVLIGLGGIGQTVLNKLQSLRVGEALEAGVAIVLMAITLDRLSQAAARKRPEHHDEGLPFWRLHPHVVAAVVIAIVAIVMANVTDWAHSYPDTPARDWTISTAPFWEAIVDYVQVEWRSALLSVKDFLLLEFLLPLRDFFVSIPWVAGVALAAGIGWRIAGARLAAIAGGFIAFIAIAGFWIPAMESLYLAVASVIIAVGFGVPLGIVASRWDWSYNAMQVVLDTFQTLPAFIYLIPVVMLFQVGAVAALTAILVYGFVPAVRYTMLGMRNVPHEVIEAADTSGCTRLQRLFKVKLPLAVPEIMLGVNQVLMFSLLMVMIAALIGGIDGLGDEILIALRDQDAGKGLIVGLCLAALGLAADQLITTWSEKRKRQLGLA